MIVCRISGSSIFVQGTIRQVILDMFCREPGAEITRMVPERTTRPNHAQIALGKGLRETINVICLAVGKCERRDEGILGTLLIIVQKQCMNEERRPDKVLIELKSPSPVKWKMRLNARVLHGGIEDASAVGCRCPAKCE
jgi:hypothetical protein